MKKILLIAVAAFISVSVYAQGTVNFSTSAVRITRAPEKGGGDVPAGTIAGPYLAALFFAPLGVTDESMFMQLGANSGFAASGRIIGGTRTTPTVGTFNFQVRTWEVADPNHVGRSSIFSVTTGNPNASPPLAPAAIVPPMTGFAMVIVPEPSVIALGALGAGALLLLRRRK